MGDDSFFRMQLLRKYNAPKTDTCCAGVVQYWDNAYRAVPDSGFVNLTRAGFDDRNLAGARFVICSRNCLTLSPPIPLRLYTLSYWSNPPFLIFDIRALWHSGVSARSPECQKIKNGGLDQYGTEPFEQQQFGTAGIEAVKLSGYS